MSDDEPDIIADYLKIIYTNIFYLFLKNNFKKVFIDLYSFQIWPNFKKSLNNVLRFFKVYKTPFNNHFYFKKIYGIVYYNTVYTFSINPVLAMPEKIFI